VALLRVLARMIGFIGASLQLHLLNNQYSAIADLHTFQFIVAHALGSSVSTSRLLTTDLITGNISSDHYDVFASFLPQPPWTADSPELDPIPKFYLPV
jgi:hypothetical protein